MKARFILLLIFSLTISLSFASDPTDLIINGEKCGPHGSARPGTKEYDQNVFKNRFDFPKAADFNKSITLEKMMKARETEAGFNQSTAVEVEGYVFDVKKGGVETCNCKTTETLFRDTHIELTLNESETGKEFRVIVEVTPRIRQMLEEQGIDWTTEGLKNSIKGKYVRIQGWLFFDISHRTESFADDPDDNIGRKNWRASSWEIHPITSIEILGDDNMEVYTEEETDDYTAPVSFSDNSGPGVTATRETTTKKNDMASNSPVNMLVIIILGAILGMAGQGMRIVVGLKKMNELATREGISSDELFKTRQLVMSLFIAFAIGAISGVLAAITKVNSTITQAEVTAFVAAGYAGTDFIEGFIKKNNPSAPVNKPS